MRRPGLYAQQVFMKDAGFKTLAYTDVSRPG
jgi:hypothetical protein